MPIQVGQFRATPFVEYDNNARMQLLGAIDVSDPEYSKIPSWIANNISPNNFLESSYRHCSAIDSKNENNVGANNLNSVKMNSFLILLWSYPP